MQGITIVTPSLNQARYLEQCIDSVLSQDYPDLEYIIMDGGSTDGSVDIIKRYEKHLTYWQSGPDGGQYQALNAGFRRSTKPIMGWLNADDMLHPGGLSVVKEVFSRRTEVEFLTGKRVGFDGNGDIVSYGRIDQRWCHDLLLDKSLVQKETLFIMQEATFWRRSLWERAGGELDTSYSLAADFELWLRMSRHAPLYTVNALTGGFRCYSVEQRCNKSRNEYVEQCCEVIDREVALNLPPASHRSAPPPVIDYPLVEKPPVGFQILARQELPKISIVTPSFNQADYLEECLDSVLSQNYPNLEYIVMDGGSTDGSPEIVKKYEKHLNYWQSKKDYGQYHAVNTGFAISTGEIMAWLNSDDKYHPGALWLVADTFRAFPEVRWLTGSPTLWDKEGNVIGFSSAPPVFSREKYLRGEIHSPYIQQESTFWHRSLWDQAGSCLSPDFPLAADMELWARFFRFARLQTLHAPLGGFRSHPGEGQRSEAFASKYAEEAQRIVAREQTLHGAASTTACLPAPAPLGVPEVAARAKSALAAENFAFFSYSRSFHLAYFARHGAKLHGRTISSAECDPRQYQELFCYSFLRENVAPGARVLLAGDAFPLFLACAAEEYELSHLTSRGAVAAPRTACRALTGEPGSFPPTLPGDHFDLVISLFPPEFPDEARAQAVYRDIQRVLKPGGWSLHLFDVVDDGTRFCASGLLSWLHRHLKGRPVPFRQASLDPFAHALDRRAHGGGVWFSWQFLWRKEEPPREAPHPGEPAAPEPTGHRRAAQPPAPLLQDDQAALRHPAALFSNEPAPLGETMSNPPHIFTVETTLACDLSCPECAIGGGMIRRDRQLMSFASYRIIADKIRPYARYVYLHIWGEPMLNPDIFEMIRYTSRFAGTNISTNGQSMTPEKAKELIASGVTDVIVSIDGASQEVYRKYRVGGEAEKAFRALELLVEENRARGGRVNIIPQFIVFEHNQHEMEPFAARCRKLGLSPSFKAPYLRKDDSRFAYCGNPAFHRPHLPDLASLRDAMKECPNTKEVFTVLSDGSVVACCHDYSGATTFGNIYSQEVMEIWDAPRCRAFREAVDRGNAPGFCTESCMTWFLDKRAKAPETEPPRMVNLCCGPILIPGFINIDAMPGGDLQIDLERESLPFPDASVDALVCISAINYFSYERGRQIVADVHRVLKPGGIARFATQDLKLLARRYLERDRDFYFQALPDGRDRFPGETFCDKLNAFFYGFYSGDKHCKYVYDAESLSRHFHAAGFARVEEKPYLDSAIPGAERFDNRPEQMFFLEAVKGAAPGAVEGETRYEALMRRKERQLGKAGQSAAGFRERGVGIMAQNPEKGWQLLLKALELDPSDREATLTCAAVLQKKERYGDLVKLFSSYLKAVPSDAEMVARAKEALALAEAKQEGHRGQAMRQQPLIAALDARRNPVLSDREHLEAGMKWLRHAQKVNPAGGVAAAYYLDTLTWDVDYPETTGYIIPTFLAHYRLTGDRSYRDDAIRMGEWEVDIQAPEGGAGEPCGVFGQRPRVFNTGQVLLGFVSLYRETGDRAFLEAGIRAGDWILSCQDEDGKWGRGVYRGPRSYKSRVAWGLLELAEASGCERFRTGGRRAIEWTLAQAEENGFFRENSLTDPDRPWTHLIGYVHVGLLEACRFKEAGFDRERTLGLLRNAARALAAQYVRRRSAIPPGELTVFPGTFDASWESRDTWSCITGNAQIEFFLRRMLEHLDDRQLEKAADGMLEDLKRLQYIDGIDSADLFGGLPGAYPLAAPYCTNSVPNWGVKFFADSLLQRLSPAKELDCIG